VSIPRVSNFTKFTSSIQGWKKEWKTVREWKRARLNAGMRSSQCVCSRDDDNLQLRHIQLISFPGFSFWAEEIGNEEHRESCKCLGCRRKEALTWQEARQLGDEATLWKHFPMPSRLWETWSSLSLLHCLAQLLQLYEGVFLINNKFHLCRRPKLCMRGKDP